jgi:hypothetical protein
MTGAAPRQAAALGGFPMLEKLDFMMRFWSLHARYAALGAPLSAFEQIELLSLIRLMSTDYPLPEPGPLPRAEPGLAVQLTAPGGFLKGQLKVVCAGGLVIACSSPLRAGQSTILRLADAETEVEYTIPCVVSWTYAGVPSAMALRVDGAPARMNVESPMPGMWRSPLGLQRREALETQAQ